MSSAPAADRRTHGAARLHALPPVETASAPRADAPREHAAPAHDPHAHVPHGDGAPIADLHTGTRTTVDGVWQADPPALALRRGSLSGTDLDEARDRAAALYPGAEITVEKGPAPFSYRYSFLGDEHVTLRSASISAVVRGRIPSLPDYVAGWWREGSGVIDPGPHEVRSKGSRPFLLPPGRAFAFRCEPGVQNLVHVDAAFLEETATEFHDGRARPLVFDHAHAPDPERSAQWRQAVAEASPVLQDATSAPLQRFQAGLLVARATLQLFPWHDVPFSAELRAPRMSGVRAAIEYMHHHADQPITPADAARSAGISTRVLQLAVRRYEDTTPSALLRGIRLDRVHAQLQSSTPTTTTVRAVAEQWGFGHLGRFAASYAERFGELPSATLRG